MPPKFKIATEKPKEQVRTTIRKTKTKPKKKEVLVEQNILDDDEITLSLYNLKNAYNISNKLLILINKQYEKQSEDDLNYIYTNLLYKIPFDEEEIEAIINKYDFLSTKKDELEEFSNILNKIPIELRKNITAIEKELANIDNNNKPVNIIYYIKNAYLIDTDYLNELKRDYNISPYLQNLIIEYNKNLKQLIDVEYDEGKIESKKTKASKKTKNMWLELKNKLKQSRYDFLNDVKEETYLTFYNLPEKVETETSKDIDEARRIVDVIVNQRRGDIAKRIAQEKNIEYIKDISDKEIDDYIIKLDNLPYLAFLLEFVNNPISENHEINDLLKNYPEISIQFSRLFQRLSFQNKLEFVNTLFLAYPLQEYPDGPDVEIINILISYYNRLVTWDIDEDTDIDFQLVESEPDKFLDIVYSLESFELLQYRNIIFSRLDIVDSPDRNNILEIYNKFLINDKYKLVYEDDKVKKYSDDVVLDIHDEDFIIPSTDSLKQSIMQYLNKNIKSLLNKLNLTKVPSRDELKSLNILVGSNQFSFILYVKGLLTNYYNSILPMEYNFDNDLIDMILSIIEDKFREDMNDITNVDIDIPENILHDINSKIKSHKYSDRVTIKIDELKNSAQKYGIDLGKGIAFAGNKALTNLDNKYKNKEITLDEYEISRKNVMDVIESYEQLKKTMRIEDTENKLKINSLMKLFNKEVSTISNELRNKGESIVDLSNIHSQAIQNLLSIELINEDDVRLIEIQLVDPFYHGKVYSRKTKNELANIVKNMPDALKESIQNMIDNISIEYNNISKGKEKELNNYYKFITNIIILNWGYNKNKTTATTLKDLELEYSDKLPMHFMKSVFNKIEQGNVNGNELIRYVTEYTGKKVQILKNPLIRNKIRRKQRYNKLFDGMKTRGTISKIKLDIPKIAPPHIKECILIHKTKPWLDIPNIDQWNFVIAHSSGMKLSELPENIKIFFNPVSVSEIIVNTPKYKNLHFYRPSSTYWVNHCKMLHKNNKCDTSELLKTLTDSTGNDIQFWELIYTNPVIGKFDSDNNLVIDYKGDTDRLKFLSMNKVNYEKECKWFESKERDPLKVLNELKYKDLRGKDENAIRFSVRTELSVVLSLHQLKTGINDDIKVRSERLENALYNNFIERKGVSIYSYLSDVFSFIIFVDPLNKVGKLSKFFNSLVTQSSTSYYPELLKQFSTYNSRLPEIYYLPPNDTNNKMKDDTTNYINNIIDVSIDKFLLKLISYEFDANKIYSLSSMLNAKTNEFAMILPDSMGSSLKNVCKNANEFGAMDDSFLMYYIKGDEVYCISKLQLAGMAQRGVYTYNNIEFEREFVDNFKLYSSFASSVLKRRTDLIDETIKTLINIPENKVILDDLLFEKTLSENNVISSDILDELGFFKLVVPIVDKEDAYIIMVITNKVNEILEEYEINKIEELATQFIESNINKIKQLIEDNYKLYHEQNPVTPSNINNLSAIKNFIQQEDYMKNIMNPVIDIVENYVDDNSMYRIKPEYKLIIMHIIEDVIQKQKETTEVERECDKCKEKTKDIKYSTVVQTREGDKIISRDAHFCSYKCFLDQKQKEPSKKDIERGRLQNAVNKVTEQYLNYTQMLFWAKFPSMFKIPTNVFERNKFIDNVSIITGIPENQVINSLENLNSNENALGIITSRFGKNISETELWDRIRTNNLFVPSVSEMLKENKLMSLVYLARKYNIPIYGNFTLDYEDLYNYYSKNTEELRNIWKSLRTNENFKELLFSTVETFNPYESQRKNIQVANQDVINNILQKSNYKYNEPQDIFTNIERKIPSIFVNISNLEEFIKDPVRFKKIREFCINEILRAYPSLKLINKEDKRILLTTRNTLKILFERAQSSILNNKQFTIETQEDKNTFSTQQLINILNNNCKYKTQISDKNKFTRFIYEITQKTMKRIKNAKELKFSFNTFFSILSNELNCDNLNKINQEYNKSLFTLQKLNYIIDNAIADVILSQQNKIIDEQPKPPQPKYKRKNVQRYTRREDEEEVLLTYIPSLVVEQAEEPRDKAKILNEIKELKKKLYEPKEKIAPKTKITWENIPNKQILDFIKESEEEFKQSEIDDIAKEEEEFVADGDNDEEEFEVVDEDNDENNIDYDYQDEEEKEYQQDGEDGGIEEIY